MYQSPIEIITRQMRTQFEDNVFKAIQDYGIVVDKEELLKALQYDRGQYEKGFADGMLVSKDEWISVGKPPEVYRDEYGELIPFLVCCKGTVYPFRAVYDGTNWGDGIGRLKVTHWMPLPEPPKKGGE